jgi:hypothetical protein
MWATLEQYFQGNQCHVNFYSEQGQKIFPLSRDHKPNDDLERKRIVEGGGQIYQ